MIWNYSFYAKCFITQVRYSCFVFSFWANQVSLIKNTSVTGSTSMITHQMKYNHVKDVCMDRERGDFRSLIIRFFLSCFMSDCINKITLKVSALIEVLEWLMVVFSILIFSGRCCAFFFL